MKLLDRLMSSGNLNRKQCVFAFFVLFGFFIAVFAVFHSSKYIEPQIDYGDLKIDGEFIPYIYRGTLIINSQPQYHMVRIQRIHSC